MKTINTERLPILSWAEDIDINALEQAKNLANLPFAFNHISLMPDAHFGYGMPIGGVLATTDMIIPNAVGVDIGCGMCAIKTSLTEIDRETLKKIMNEIRKVIPVGSGHHRIKQDEKLMPQLDKGTVCERQYDAALEQIGTLGGGNHFIEMQKGSDGYIWIMLHSGSRNFGLQTANYHNDIAIELNEKWYTAVPKEWELAGLPIDSKEGQDYIEDMNYCVAFALANRKLMMDRIIEIFHNTCNGLKDLGIKQSGINFDPMINIAHNYATLEHHLGKNVMVHRKGATLARTGITGIIPGSQGTKSYIVEGKGDKMSFESCSHGAGRKMGRKEAERTLDLAAEIKLLDDQNIIHSIRGKHDLDEATGAYKPIDVVMNNQMDLVDILVELTPLAVIKG